MVNTDPTRLLITVVHLCLMEVAYASTSVDGLRVRPSPERTRVVFDLAQPAEHKHLHWETLIG